jgi:hypothetical protein
MSKYDERNPNWQRLAMHEVAIFTRAKLLAIGVNPDPPEVGYFIYRDDDVIGASVKTIGVPKLEDLREVLSGLRSVSIRYCCMPEERAALRALIEAVRNDRRVIETTH